MPAVRIRSPRRSPRPSPAPTAPMAPVVIPAPTASTPAPAPAAPVIRRITPAAPAPAAAATPSNASTAWTGAKYLLKSILLLGVVLAGLLFLSHIVMRMTIGLFTTFVQ